MKLTNSLNVVEENRSTIEVIYLKLGYLFCRMVA